MKVITRCTQGVWKTVAGAVGARSPATVSPVHGDEPRVLVYCAKRWKVSTWLTVAPVFRARFLASPPLDGHTFPYRELGDCDLVYIRLHGVPEQPYLLNDRWDTAFSVENLCASEVDLGGVIAFLEGCHGALTGFPEAFLDLGAAAVVSSKYETKNRRFTLGEAGKYGKRLLKGLRTMSVTAAKRRADDLFLPHAKYVLAGDGQAIMKRRTEKCRDLI